MPKDSKCLDCGTAITNIAKRCQPCNLKSNRGRKYSAESRAKMSAWQFGENNPNWKGENRKTLSEIGRTYRKKHRIESNERARKYRKTHPEKRKLWSETSRLTSIRKWVGLIPQETQCQICGRKIIFNSGIRSESIHFDHKHSNTPIKKSPSTWLNAHGRNPKNEAVWISCDFGMVCHQCNKGLPTENRNQYVKNVCKYVLGVNIE